MVVGLTIETIGEKFPQIPDVFYSRRVKELVSRGLIESSGNLDYMRYSEIRLHQVPDKQKRASSDP